ncbi:MAG: hypothetical protein WA584_05445 [Pyrinomonadaceae bacterium]
MTGTLSGFLAYGYLRFPANAAVIAVLAGAIIAVVFFGSRAEKAARLKVFYAAANEFGAPVSFDNYSASFERNGICFECEFPRDKTNNRVKVRFYIPNVRQKFIIQHNALLKKELFDCQYLTSSPLPKDIFLSAGNQDFLLNLLKNKNILDEIYNYPAGFASGFSIVFDDGSFEIEKIPKFSEYHDGFYQLCQTAVVFHDELKKQAKTS